MKNISTSDKIYVNNSKIKNSGRGVFASQDIKKNELIERCPVIEIQNEDPSNATEGILITYLFYFGKKKVGQVIALGFGSIYNHSRIPNAIYKIKQREGIIDFIAVKDIKKNDEITINYNYLNPEDKNPLWFEEV